MPMQAGGEQRDIIVSAKNVIKEFSGVRVLDNVDFELRKGEIHALLGENGAGKSTLMKILCGVHGKTAGTLVVNGREVDFKCRSDAEEAGIGIVFQEFSQVKPLTVAENMHLNNYPKTTGFLRRIDWKKMAETTRKRFGDFNIEIDPNALVKNLGVAKQQIVEIVKAIINRTNILIMDEPTAALTETEIEAVFGFIRELKEKGISIIYISHRLDEIFQICDRATILRDGKVISTVEVKDVTKDQIISHMLGREMEALYPERSGSDFADKEVLLEASGISVPGKFENISFKLRRGEIVGFTGLVGAGKTELCQAIYGLEPDFTGKIYINGAEARFRSPEEAKKAGIALVPENRKEQGVVMSLAAIDNISFSNLKQFKNSLGKISVRKERETSDRYFRMLDIRPNDPSKRVRYFSGGNQQKVVVAKWLCSNSTIFMFDEPTRGIDIGAKVEIYRIIRRLADEGNGVIIASSETPEVLGMSDNIYVMSNGRITRQYRGAEVGLEELTHVVNS